MINYNILVDLCGERTTYTDIVFTSGDIFAYRLNFSFTQNGAPVDVSDCTLLIKAKRKDGVVITDAGKIENGLAFVDIKNSMIALSGEVSFEVALCGASGSYITTKELIAHVREGHGDSGISAEDTAPVLSSLLIAASEIKSTANDAKTVAQDAKTVANDAKTLASEAKRLAVDTYNRESIDAFMDSKADKLTVYTKNETDELLKEIGTRQIVPITIEENENGSFSVTQTPSLSAHIDPRNTILQTTILPSNVTVYSSSMTVVRQTHFWTVFYDTDDFVRILTISEFGNSWVVFEDKLVSESELDTAIEEVDKKIKASKPVVLPITIEEDENGSFSVTQTPSTANINLEDAILKTTILPSNNVVYSSSMTVVRQTHFWTVFYDTDDFVRILTISEFGNSWVVFEDKLVSESELDEMVGDIEASLDNIITKYGLGGDTV